MLTRIYAIFYKELLQTVREPRMRFFLFVPLIFELVLFGYAVNLDLENINIAWLDRDSSPHSRQLRDAFSGSATFSIVANPADDFEAQRLLDRGEVLAVVVILPGFARDLERGQQASVQVQVDGSNSNTGAIVSSYLTQVINSFAADFRFKQQRGRAIEGVSSAAVAGAHSPRITARSRVWFNEELKSRNYFVPGVVVNLVMITTIVLTALAIVREKEIGTMEQLMVTPVRALELIIGKTAPFAIVGLVQLTMATLLALMIFHIPFRGNPLLLFASGILFLLTTLGSGVFLSTTANTQQQAVLSTFMFLMPAFLLSGFAFPIHSMPLIFQYVTYLNPMRYFIEIVRGIFLRGSGLTVLWPQMLALAGLGIAVLGFSALRFKKRLD
jgi:ABC-2 type transport system permease protein